MGYLMKKCTYNTGCEGLLIPIVKDRHQPELLCSGCGYSCPPDSHDSWTYWARQWIKMVDDE